MTAADERSRLRLRLLLAAADAEQIICDVAVVGSPDLAAIDALARLQLAAQRLGSSLRLQHASSELMGLLALTGLDEVVGIAPGLALEADREPEDREEVGVDEGVDPGDPAS